jgi:hypothetical protein
MRDNDGNAHDVHALNSVVQNSLYQRGDSSMKKLILCIALGFAAFSANAAPAISCEEVDQLGEALTTLGVAMDDENAVIGEGSEEDQALHDTVVGLAEIAKAEGDEDLAAASVNMAAAWDAMDRDAFTDALADAVVKLAVIHGTECGGE